MNCIDLRSCISTFRGRGFKSPPIFVGLIESFRAFYRNQIPYAAGHPVTRISRIKCFYFHSTQSTTSQPSSMEIAYPLRVLCTFLECVFHGTRVNLFSDFHGTRDIV